ncbi:P-loop containing nucleoside triphosphate hydrolase protein [Immersiella caudata]|uniref:P-loop containing nucleoside triphosphate hydrolase protein n=1 Tax=Immersiella caudata TaxID=314043 RepID=A0AA40C7D7_9PEZI|nr:P-loop containing nucleoside triphosphate hydrolase protein [Immersiella caudata]
MSANLKDPLPVILLIGPSGSGKSSFVKVLTTEAVQIESEDKPCTNDCRTYKVEPRFNGYIKPFLLIDTPGFVEPADENLKILRKIAKTLSRLDRDVVYGAIYFHNISEMRLKGTTAAILDIFKAICGEKFYPHVAFVTTMWDTVNPAYHQRLEIANGELEKGAMRLDGAPEMTFKRRRDDDYCSKEVLEHFAILRKKRYPPPQLQLMKELQGRDVGNIGHIRTTSAGCLIPQDRRTSASGCCTIM